MSSGAVSAEEGTMGEISISSQGKIDIEGPRSSSINIDYNGSLVAQSSSYVVRSDVDISMGAGSAGEFKVIHNASRSTGQVNFRVRENKIISHVPIQTPELSSPSDERIKREIVDVDGEDLLLRLQAGLEPVRVLQGLLIVWCDRRAHYEKVVPSHPASSAL